MQNARFRRPKAGMQRLWFDCERSGCQSGDFIGSSLAWDIILVLGIDAALESALDLNPIPGGAAADLLGSAPPEDAR